VNVFRVNLQIFRVDDMPMETKMLTDALDNAQKKVEAYFFNIRKQLWEYDQVRHALLVAGQCGASQPAALHR
jgi:preprotein translocase subunit SecA